MAIQEVLFILSVPFQTLNALCMQLLLVKFYNSFKRPKIKTYLHFLLVWNVLLMHHLRTTDSLPQILKFRFRNSCWLDELHIIDIYLFGNQIRLLQTCMIVKVNVSVYHSEFTTRKPQLGSEQYALF